MVLEIPTDNIQSDSRVDSHQKNEAIDEILNSPSIILMLFASLFVLVGAAIRLTRVSVASAVESFHTYVESDLSVGLGRFHCSWRSFFGNSKSFWVNLPRRVWNFYIDAFLVPSYRKEWGRYRSWSYRAQRRPPKSNLLKEEIRLQKKRMEAKEAKAKEAPKPIPHEHSGCARVIINVAGLHYETQLRTLNRFPDTLLGNEAKRLQFYDPATQEYYFDRNRHAFEAILYYYQSGGRFRRPENVPADVLLEDALFFQLSQPVIDQYRLDEGLAQSVNRDEVVPMGLLRRKIWLLFEFPESSIQSEIVAVWSIVALFLSIGIFCLETLSSLELNPVYGVDSKGAVKIVYLNPFNIYDPFFFTETICVSWFILEFLARLICCPIFSDFVKSPLNVIDCIALLPFFISIAPLLTGSFNGDEDGGETFTATESLYLLRIVRIVRVFRVFKLSRHSKGLKILGKTLKASMNELGLLIFFIILGVIFFSSTMYFAELEVKGGQFESIPGGFWWALITITTVGFGDIVPLSVSGKIVGTFCAIAGVLTIALPVPVIVANFNYFYQQAIDEHDFRWININHVASCPYRPNGFRPVHLHNHHPHIHHHDHHSEIYASYTESDLKKYDRKRVGSQIHLQETIFNFMREQKHQKHHYSSDEEFKSLMKGKKC